MSFDDGFQLGMTSDDDFRAKFMALMRFHNVKFEDWCRVAGVNPNTAQDAINRGTYGLPATSGTLQQMLCVYGMDLSWLINGPAVRDTSTDAKRLELFELVYQFALRNDIPKKHRQVLIENVMAKIDNAPSTSVRLAARVGVPRTMADVGYLYKDLLRRGHIR